MVSTRKQALFRMVSASCLAQAMASEWTESLYIMTNAARSVLWFLQRAAVNAC